MKKHRAHFNAIPGLHNRVRTGRGMEHLRVLEDGRAVYFDVDPRDKVVFIFEVVAELPYPDIYSLEIIIDETVKEMNEETP